MPVQVSYPGVYVEEIPSGVRTITGVATSITAFIGRALRGPVNEAKTINSFGDFERIFGGLWVESSLGFAVRDFYMNGGSQAVIVRLFHAEPNDPAANPAVVGVPSKSKIAAGAVKLEAAYEGKWGANLRATVDLDAAKDVADRFGLAKADLFNLTVRDAAAGGASEKFLNVSFKNSPRQITNVLREESKLVRWDSANALDPANPPAPAAADDPVTVAEKALTAAKKANPQVPATITAAETALAAAMKTASDAVSDGKALTFDDFKPANAESKKLGLYALEQLFARDGLFNILSIPPYKNGDVDVNLVSEAAAYCEKRRAFLLVDPPSNWIDKDTAKNKFTDTATDNVGTRSRNSALFFPRLKQPNPLKDNQSEEFVPSGAVAGIFARTDTQRGVWKAPAGLDASLVGVPQLSVPMSDEENGELNQLGINSLRSFPTAGRVVWGARTLRGADQLADEWKYIPVRRLALYIEESLYRGTQWVVFEPNDEPLWAQIRLNVGAFMHNLFRQGAFQGQSPKEAYFVKCDKETTPQNQIDLGIVNIVVGFAPLKPAEFVIIKLQQIAGQIET